MMRALVVLVLLASPLHADDVALLPLDASAKLDVYGQPVASEIARALIAGELDVVVVLPKMNVPDSAKLIVDGKIASAKGGAIELAIRVRDPKSGTILHTLEASAPSLATLDKTTAELAQKLLAVVRAQLAELAKPPIEPEKPKTVHAPPPPVAKPLLVAIAGTKSAGALHGALDAAVTSWVLANRRTRAQADFATLRAKTAPQTVAASDADVAIAFEVLRYKLWGKTVPLGTARVRMRIVDAGQVLFDRVIVTDTIVGDRGMPADKFVERVAREVLAIAGTHVKKVMPRWR